jgi:hypothetical protein
MVLERLWKPIVYLGGALVALAVVSMLNGCSTLGPAVDQAIAGAAKANDEAIRSAEFTLCSGASVGAVRRAYGSPERAKVWQDLCNSTDQFIPSP